MASSQRPYLLFSAFVARVILFDGSHVVLVDRSEFSASILVDNTYQIFRPHRYCQCPAPRSSKIRRQRYLGLSRLKCAESKVVAAKEGAQSRAG